MPPRIPALEEGFPDTFEDYLSGDPGVVWPEPISVLFSPLLPLSFVGVGGESTASCETRADASQDRRLLFESGSVEPILGAACLTCSNSSGDGAARLRFAAQGEAPLAVH